MGCQHPPRLSLLGTHDNGTEAKRYSKNLYASAIWIILYLESNTIPDIYFAVHKCDRFTHNTKSSHETDVKRTCWYLQATKDKVLVFNLFNKMVVVYYNYEYYAGMWGHENSQDPICARSRTGFVITFSIFLYCGFISYKRLFLYLL